MGDRLILERECEHGRLFEHPLPGTEKPHDDGSPGWVRVMCAEGVRLQVTVDYEAALAELRRARPEWTPFVGDPFVIHNIVDAALTIKGTGDICPMCKGRKFYTDGPCDTCGGLGRIGREVGSISPCGRCDGVGEVRVHCLYGLGGSADDHDDCDDPNCVWVDEHPCPDCGFDSPASGGTVNAPLEEGGAQLLLEAVYDSEDERWMIDKRLEEGERAARCTDWPGYPGLHYQQIVEVW